MDQSWPLWVRPQFEPALGGDAFKTLTETVAIDNPPNGRGDPYTGDAVCEQVKDLDPQWCFDAVRQRPTGGASQPLIHWINRPTYQQVVEIPRRLPR